MGGKSSKQVLGYRYRHLFFDVWCQSADTLHRLVAGGKRAWEGCVHSNQTVQVNAPALWGDDNDNGEGGLRGSLDVQFGGESQGVNARLMSKIGPRQTGNRGFFSTVYEGIYGSWMPNPKPRAALIERIHAGWGTPQAWYPEKAAIALRAGEGGDPGSGPIGWLLAATGGTGGTVKSSPDGLDWSASMVAAPIVGGTQWAPTGTTEMVHYGGEVLGMSVSAGAGSAPHAFRDVSGAWHHVTLQASYPADGGRAMHNGSRWVSFGVGAGDLELSADGKAFTTTTYNLQTGCVFGGRMLLAHNTNATVGRVQFRTCALDGADFVDAGIHDFPHYGGGALYGACLATDGVTIGIMIAEMVDGSATDRRVRFHKATSIPSGGAWAWTEVPTVFPLWAGVGDLGHIRFHYSPRLDRWFAMALNRIAHGQTIDSMVLDARVFPNNILGFGDDGQKIVVCGAGGMLEAWTPDGGWQALNPGPGIGTGTTILDVVALGEYVAPTPVTRCGIYSMNPAHIIRHQLVRKKGIPDAMLSEASFSYAADMLHAEGFGLCELIQPDNETPEDAILRICDIIGANCTQSRTDGLIYLDLLRDDYTLTALPTITDDDIVSWQDEQAVPGEAANSVQIGWRDVLEDGGLDRVTPPSKALGHIRSTGREMHQQIDMRGIPFEAIAMRVAERERIARSTPLHRITATTLRKHASLRPGQALRLLCPLRGIPDMVVRVGEVDHGTPLDGQLRWVWLQDIFNLPDSVAIDPSAPPGSTPGAPLLSDASVAIESPYAELVAALTPEQMGRLAADTGYLLAGVGTPARGSSFGVYSALPSETLAQRGGGELCAHGVTAHAVLPLDASVQLSTVRGAERVDIGSWGLWESEIVRVDALYANGLCSLARGCVDTLPQAHAAGTSILFMGDDHGTDAREYAASEVLSVKLTVKAGAEEQPLASATAHSVTFASRQARPYVQGNVQVGGVRVLAGDPAPPAEPPAPSPSTLSIVGSLLSGAVGVEYTQLYTDDEWRVLGSGSDGAVIIGTLPPGLTARGTEIVGKPLLAGVYQVSLTAMYNGQTASYSGRIVIAAKPAHARPDWRPRGRRGQRPGVIRVTENRVRFSGGGGLLSDSGVSAGLVRGEFEVLSFSSTLHVGINASADPTYHGVTGVNCASYALTAPGMYAVELNAGTGAWAVLNSAAAVVASGTLSVASAHDGKYRIGLQAGADGLVEINFGRNVWGITPTAGYAGVPIGTVTVLPQWDSSTSNGEAVIDTDGVHPGYSNTVLFGPAGGFRLPDLVRATIGKTTGKWRFGLTTRALAVHQWAGIAKATTPIGTDSLGTDSVGIRPRTPGDNNLTVRKNVGGTITDTSIAPIADGTDTFVFALDADAGSVAIYVKTSAGALVLAHTVSGLPAGPWYPAVHGAYGNSAVLIASPPAVTGYADWTAQL